MLALTGPHVAKRVLAVVHEACPAILTVYTKPGPSTSRRGAFAAIGASKTPYVVVPLAPAPRSTEQPIAYGSAGLRSISELCRHVTSSHICRTYSVGCPTCSHSKLCPPADRARWNARHICTRGTKPPVRNHLHSRTGSVSAQYHALGSTDTTQRRTLPALHHTSYLQEDTIIAQAYDQTYKRISDDASSNEPSVRLEGQRRARPGSSWVCLTRS